MNHNHNSTHLQSRFNKVSGSIDSLSFFNLLTSPKILSTIEQLQPEFRERKYPPTETLSLFLSQAMSADRSCQYAVDNIAVQRLTHGLPLVSTHTGSYCKARQRLPTSLVRELVRCTSQLINDQLPTHWHWQGRPVRLIDGTTVMMADTPENQTAYPQLKVQKPGLGFPIARIVGIVCLASGSVINAAIGRYMGKGADEHSLLRTMLDTFEAGDIVLGDANFGSYFLFAELQARRVDAVFEQFGPRRKTIDFRKGKKLGKKDHCIIYEKPKKRPCWMTEEDYCAAPPTLTIREVQVGRKVLVTTLLSASKTPKLSLKELYKDRWHIELDLRNIKITMGMDMLSCKSPAMVEKEIWVYLLAYNLIRLVMAQSASLVDILPRQISFKHSLRIWHIFRQQLGSIDDDECLIKLCLLIAEQRVGRRPGRIEPRSLKRRPKAYPVLTKPRSEAREHVRCYGHPKK